MIGVELQPREESGDHAEEGQFENAQRPHGQGPATPQPSRNDRQDHYFASDDKEPERTMVQGGFLQQQVPDKVQGKPGEDDQDGQMQAGPEQARHFVGES